ncbi:MAG: hypothetical protein KKC79_13430 [Gammaproteobacteria bacterium]|nr:hypothetical protein [Gammaproteobacteria bacterium]
MAIFVVEQQPSDVPFLKYSISGKVVSFRFCDGSNLTISGNQIVSRGALKTIAAVNHFGLTLSFCNVYTPGESDEFTSTPQRRPEQPSICSIATGSHDRCSHRRKF